MLVDPLKREIVLRKRFGDNFNKEIAAISRQSYFDNHRKNNPELYEKTKFLNDIYGNVSIPQRKWHIENNIFHIVMCRTCNKNPSPFNKKHKSYKNCSDECFRKEISNKATISMSKQETKDKIKNAFIERYGEKNPYKIIGDSMKKTNLERYGVDNQAKRQEIKNKTHIIRTEIFRKNTVPEGYELIYKDTHINKLKHLVCGKEFGINPSTYLVRKDKNSIICTHCLPLYKSAPEIELFDYIASIYSGNIIRNPRNIIDNLELDIYIPTLKLAFEYNGLYWHSEIYKDKNYHQNKWQVCKDKGIRLVTIWEDSWHNKKDIIKSIINGIFNFNQTKIYARKCVIRKVDNKSERKFLDENHNQGYLASSVCYGLYHDDELVQIMSFKKLKDKFEIARICSKLNCQITGGILKLFKAFESEYNYKHLISYCDLSLFEGKVYGKLGMKFVHNTVPSYYYFNRFDSRNSKRLHRIGFQKWKLLKQYPQFDNSMTEIEIMIELGYERIYCLGNSLYELKMCLK